MKLGRIFLSYYYSVTLHYITDLLLKSLLYCEKSRSVYYAFMNKEMQGSEVDANELPEETAAIIEREPPYSYEGYIALGGRIDEENYQRVMKRASEESSHFRVNQLRDQTRSTADVSGISLDVVRDEACIDPRCIYEILRYDVKPADVKDHHSQMCDQQLLVESLRMLEQGSAAQAIIDRHPHISFN